MTPAPNTPEKRTAGGLDGVVRLAVGIMTVLLIVAASRVNWEATPDSKSELRISWRYASPTTKACRPPTEAELAGLPQHMRPAEICEGGPIPFSLRIALDGRVLGVAAQRELFDEDDVDGLEHVRQRAQIGAAGGPDLLTEQRLEPGDELVRLVDGVGRRLQLVGTHPMIPLGQRNYAARNTQLATVGDLLRRGDGARLHVGDLNASLWDLNYRTLEARTGLRNVRRGFGILPTWPTFLPFAMIPIDHVLVSGEVGVVDVRTGARIGSDHLPLVVTLTL